MRVIFLDFDGVLNSRRFFHANRGKSGGPLGEAGALSPVLVRRLNRIIEVTGAVVVVSSSWRLGRTVDELSEILGKRGFIGTVVDKTPDYADCCRSDDRGDECVGSPRGHEILAWLADHPCTAVVLDDNSDMDGVKHRFIQTDMETGLTDADVERAIEMLLDGEP